MASIVFVIGFFLICGGWVGVSGAATLSAQIASLNVAVAGLTVTLVASAVYLLDFRRQLGARLRRLKAGQEGS